MEVLLRVVLPVFSALGSALLSFWVTRARMEAAFAKEREAMADRRIALLEQYIKDREEAGKRYRSGEVARDFRLEVRMIHEKTIAPSIDAPPALPSREQYSAGTKPRRALPSKTEGVWRWLTRIPI